MRGLSLPRHGLLIRSYMVLAVFDRLDNTCELFELRNEDGLEEVLMEIVLFLGFCTEDTMEDSDWSGV